MRQVHQGLSVGQGGPNRRLESSGEGGEGLGTVPNSAPPPRRHWGAWLGWGPYPATRIVLLFKHVLRGGSAGLGGGHPWLPDRGKMRQLQGQPPRPPTKRPPPARNQSSPLWCQGRLLGTRTAPWGPGPASEDTQYLLPRASSGLRPRRTPGRRRCPVWKELDPISAKRGINPAPPSPAPGLCESSPPRKPDGARQGALPSGSGGVILSCNF